MNSKRNAQIALEAVLLLCMVLGVSVLFIKAYVKLEKNWKKEVSKPWFQK